MRTRFRPSPNLTLHALLGGATDLTDNDLAFERSEDNEPELDYINARLASNTVQSSKAGLLAINIHNARTMAD